MKDLNNIIIMKCGTHASEKIENIFKRKKLEESNNGYIYWGYGGTVCNPSSQVQPFCKNVDKVYLLLTPTPSELYNDPKRSEEFSTDKLTWQPIEPGINVYGSRYALVIHNLQECDFEIDLYDYEIAIGDSKGKNLAEYLNGRVDKACAIKKENTSSNNSKKIKIVMIAELVNPYAVFVRQK